MDVYIQKKKRKVIDWNKVQQIYDERFFTLHQLGELLGIKIHAIWRAQQRGYFKSRPHSEVTKVTNSNRKGIPHTEELKAKIRETIQRKVSEGTWHTSLAKKMHYEYKGINLHGKWEVRYAEWLDLNNIQWERCKDSFSYTYQNKTRKYTPDFYLPSTQEYIEIKGYKTDKDTAKWNQFPKKLKIIMKRDLIDLGIKV
jgi:hypothetical protein